MKAFYKMPSSFGRNTSSFTVLTVNFRTECAVFLPSIAQSYSCKGGAWHSRAIDIAGIPLRTLVEILLVGIEQVLHSGIDLQVYVFVKFEVIAYFLSLIHI